MNNVYEFLNKLLTSDDVVVIGVSFGPDSMALLNILNSLVDKYNLKIIVAHVNHKVRVESDDEELRLKSYCFDNNLIFECMRIDNYSNSNFHNEARVKRYDFFDEIIRKYKAKYLFTAHHGDDLMETVLMRLTRGSIFRGYAGIDMVYKKENYDVIRPLLFVTKDDLLEYVNSNGIPYANDLSNDSDKYTRNRYRHKLLPFLKDENKDVHLKYLKFSRLLLLNDDYILKEVNNIYDKIVVDGRIIVNKFSSIDDALKYRLLDLFLGVVYDDDIILINDKHISAIIDLINSDRVNGFVSLPLNKKLVREYNCVYFSSCFKKEYYKIEIKDGTQLPNGRSIKIKASVLNDNNICRLCSSSVKLPLYVRNRVDGDKMEVKNGKGHVRLKKIFIDEKIPIRERDMWPVVVDSNNEVVWVPGLKKSKYDSQIDKDCDIILNYE